MPDSHNMPAEYEVYQILAELRGCGCVPPGITGRVFRVLDDMRFARRPRAEVEMVERLSLILHRERIGLDDGAQMAASIDRLADEWLSTRIPDSAEDEGEAPGHAWLARGKP